MALTADEVIVELEAKVSAYNRDVNSARTNFDRNMSMMERSATRTESRVAGAFRGMRTAVGALAGIWATAASARGAQELIDSATRVDNALKVAGLSGRELESVYQSLFEFAQRNAAPIEGLVQLFSRVSIVQNELGVNTEQLIGFTENVALALRVAGTDATQASGALLQLSQALGSGTVRAEEFNSIQEGALPILQAVAAGLEEAGGSVARLRQLVLDGELSSKAFFLALEAGSVILETRVADAQTTVAQQFTTLRNAMVDAAREFNKTTDVSGKTADALGRLTGSVEVLGEFMINLADGPIGTLIGRLSELDAKARAVFEFLGRFSLVDDMVGAVGDFIAPERGRNLSEEDIQQFAERTGVGSSAPRTTPKTNRPIQTTSTKDNPASGTGGNGGRSRRSPQQKFDDSLARVRERIEAIKAETTAMAGLNPLVDDYGFALERARMEQDLLSEAKQAGIELTPALREQIGQLATEYATASAAAVQLADSQDEARRKAEEMAELGKDIVGGFVSDLRNGATAAEAFANAISKIADRMMNELLDAIFEVNGASGKGGGGGLFGGIFGGIGKVFGFSQGTANTGGRRGQPMGIVHGQEAVIPLPAGGKVPVDIKGASTASATPSKMDVRVWVDEDGNWQAAVERIADQRAGIITQGSIAKFNGDLDRTLASRVRQAQARQG